ncbi:hypothetical protein LTR91_004388 [Friedmanniomyces endolithicus]|uniref:Domain of unknown function at the cortex 1 domain-containing protein n=1 Tax=Friedmanniomyces endolithicus TaxID=329885 RepID=A0AAN6KVH0_9PEZI|nr:hypothetical protein LTR94_001195 [Friedmanniomyces endolithicus]KAK0816527.1 hypothetical protein LTR59_000155 [Friedmanniomyces endolithicus]KAK0816603.1 hypothetical protein LTR38_001992 [Friedmanniomyces endolithicus]KAK0820923.1 hypothetical protein LTR75_001242 [Friedmanniomyces endolithicus]KAK0853374.1 hypothetical protein LTR03_002935 [Friedmanniomyces endolithicus]
MADNYYLKVSAGPDYTHQSPLPINTETPTRITSPHLTANLTLRIQNFRGLTPTGAPSPHKTSPYFSSPQHAHDLYSIQFGFTLKDADINGHDLVFGNDFDHPIRDKLPPGFQQAFNIAKYWIDPGLYGDVQAEEPYLYSPLLSSMNVVRVGPKDDRAQEALEERRAAGGGGEEVQVLEEGGDADGEKWREEHKFPHDAAARKKWFLTEQHLRDVTVERGREYSCDFFNPYLDFNDFALRLPGFAMIPGITIPIISYWDGQPLRYVMRNRKTDEPLLVIVFTLVPKEQVEKKEGGAVEEEKTKEEAPSAPSGDDDVD